MTRPQPSCPTCGSSDPAKRMYEMAMGNYDYCEDPFHSQAGAVDTGVSVGSDGSVMLDGCFGSGTIFDAPVSQPPVPDERGVTDAMIEAALHARVPGGSNVMDWLPLANDEHGRPSSPHQTARDVMRCALEAALASPSPGTDYEEEAARPSPGPDGPCEWTNANGEVRSGYVVSTPPVGTAESVAQYLHDALFPPEPDAVRELIEAGWGAIDAYAPRMSKTPKQAKADARLRTALTAVKGEG